jgi:hypothetical protein
MQSDPWDPKRDRSWILIRNTVFFSCTYPVPVLVKMSSIAETFLLDFDSNLLQNRSINIYHYFFGTHSEECESFCKLNILSKLPVHIMRYLVYRYRILLL